LSQRRQYAIFFAIVALAVITALLVARKRSRGTVLSAVPRDAWLLATVDVEALRPSPLAQALVGSNGVTIPGLGKVSDACGFEPLARLTRVALVAPEAEGDFGIAFEGDFGKAELARCAEQVLRARGGNPTTEIRGSFVVVGDAAEGARARLAYRDGGPFLVGRGAWLGTMIDAVDGKAERARPELLALRTHLSEHPGAGSPGPAVVVAALLPKTMRDQLRTEMQEPARDSEPYAAVLAVDRAGFSVETGAPGSTTRLDAELHCESPDACAQVKTLVERKRFAASTNPALRLAGLGAAIDSLAVEQSGPMLTVKAEVPTDSLARMAGRLGASTLLGR
jgi:hypothetical protein